MHIHEQTPSRIVLKGVPGGRIWMVVLAGFGLVLTAAVGAFAVALYHAEKGLSWGHLPMAFGILIGQGIMWTGLVTLAIGRQALVLDRTAGTGDYQVCSPIVEAGKPCTFKLEHVHSVALETTIESRPGHEGRAGPDATVHRVRLRLNKPRRAIVLDETEHGQRERLEALGHQVAEFLGKTLTVPDAPES